MRTAPRLTGALRAFCNVSTGEDITDIVQSGKDLSERKALALEQQSKACVSWKIISRVVTQTAQTSKHEVQDALKQFLISAKAIGETLFFLSNFCNIFKKRFKHALTYFDLEESYCVKRFFLFGKFLLGI